MTAVPLAPAALAALICWAAAAPLQDAGAPPAARDLEAVPLERARAALDAGRAAEALHHAQRALVHAPCSPAALALCFEAAAGDADARALWAGALCDARLDARGGLALERALAAACAAEAPAAVGLAHARAEAVLELAALSRARAKKGRAAPDEALVAWWLAERARALARPAPALAAGLEDLPQAFELPSRVPGRVAKDLERALTAALSSGRAEDAARAAAIVRGLGNQARSEDLQDEAPSGAAALEESGARGLERARERLRARETAPLTLAELEQLEPEEQLAFTRAHADPGRPGVALSAPDGLYRLETTCGFETLLGLAETAELHHRRLAGWYGRDPFEDRPGLVRVLPEASGLESEGTPFWWAGGFQSGDRTVLRFSVGDVPGLGRGLTHELTHRFDGALYPGLPAWLAEGRAVWTAGAYGPMEAGEFVPNHVSFGTVEAAFVKGYGAAGKLRELVEGTIDDYRDNYVAGYALYVYLKLWEADGRRPFAAQLEPYMRDIARGAKDPLAHFERHFADGRDGRPAGLEAFVPGWAEFLRGFYWDSRAPWTERYVARVDGESGPWVYDEPTWTWSRARAEPYYGQDHARAAGELFLALGDEDAAAQALLWALAVDERAPARDAQLAELLERQRARDAAFVLRVDAARGRRAPGDALAAPAPFARELPRTAAFHAALLAAAEAARARGAALAAAVHAGRADALAAALGLELGAPAAPPPREPPPLHPAHEPPRRLGLAGWIEDGLTGYEERRVPGLWYAEEDGDLHVGRERPREGTGVLDRAAHQRHAFARTVERLAPGRYRIACRVQFTTSFASGALVLGHTRRDRNLRVGFSAGDFLYSIGKKEAGEDIDGVAWSVRGLRDRDGGLPGATGGGRVDFDAPRSSFALEVVVDGAALHVFVEGERVGTYHVPDGQPIGGHVGFATGQGAIRVIDPTVQRLDDTWGLGPDGAALRALDGANLVDPAAAAFDALVNRGVRGLAPAPQGALVVWVPLPELDAPDEPVDAERVAARALELAERAARFLWRVDGAQELVVALPAWLGEQRLAAIGAELEAALERGARVLRWRGAPPVYAPGAELSGATKPWLLFVDGAGVLRFAARFHGALREPPPELEHWLLVFREHRSWR